MQGSDEEFVPEDEGELGPATIKKLREKLKKAIEEKQEYLDGWQRSRADFANFKKEEAAQESHKEERIKAELIEALIPTLDSFEMAQRHAPENQELRVLDRQFSDSLKRIGVERFGKVGEKFDPYRYEALREVATDKAENNHVIESVERSGYSIGNKIIRPAQVAVYAHQ